MEEKSHSKATPPPVILSPEDRDRVETLDIHGLGIAGGRIYIQSSFYGYPGPSAYVDKDGIWKAPAPTGIESTGPIENVRLYATQFSPGQSGPTPEINFKKLISRPTITRPTAEELLPAEKQQITGTGFYKSQKVEFELIEVNPPYTKFEASTKPDGSGWWGMICEWSLRPGDYLMRTRQLYKDESSVDHISQWSERTVTVA